MERERAYHGGAMFTTAGITTQMLAFETVQFHSRSKISVCWNLMEDL